MLLAEPGHCGVCVGTCEGALAWDSLFPRLEESYRELLKVSLGTVAFAFCLETSALVFCCFLHPDISEAKFPGSCSLTMPSRKQAQLQFALREVAVSRSSHSKPHAPCYSYIVLSSFFLPV